MNLNPYLIYVADDDDDTRLRLWRAFSMTQPDCLLYEFPTGEELLDHLLNTEDRPHLILVNSLASTTHRETMPRLMVEARRRSVPVVMLGAAKSETSGSRSYPPGVANCMLLPVTHREAVQAVERLRPVWTRPGWSDMSRHAYI